MKKRIAGFISLFIFLFLFVLLTTCQKENSKPREYPRLKETQVVNISDSGATFIADIYSLGSEVISEYGFCWDKSDNLDIDLNNKLSLGIPKSTGPFSCEVKSAMEKGEKYFVKPYVKTDKRVVYGPIKSFQSLGSLAPVILGVEPLKAGWMDTIRIKGKNFSYSLYENEVKLGNVVCEITSTTDTLIGVKVSTHINTLKNIVSVETSGNTFIFKKDTFRLDPPLINDFSPKSAYWGDTLLVTGKHLKYFNYNLNDYIKLGTISCTRFGPVDEILKVKVSNDVSVAVSDLRILIGGFLLTAADQFNLIKPSITFSPLQGTWNSRIILTGRFNTLPSRNKVFFNNSEATIVSVTGNQMVVSVPPNLGDEKSVISYVAAPYTMVSRDSFRLNAPLINSFSPSTGPSGTSVTIKGKYFSPNSYKVFFGSVQAPVTSINDSVIKANVPTGISGPVKINITIFTRSVASMDDYTVNNPKIYTVYPLSGTFNDQVTITGENFIPPSGSTSVSFNGIWATIVSLTGSEIIVRVPLTCDSIPATISVYAGANNSTSTEKFTLAPLQVDNVSPAGYIPGQDIHITGQNFNPVASNNMVYWDIYPLVIKSSTTSEIVATWPDVLPRGNNMIKVVTGGYSRYSPEKFSSNSQWLRIPSPAIRTNYTDGYYYGISNYSAGIKNYGYVASAAMRAFYSFDPSNYTWLVMNTGYPFSSTYHWAAGSTVLKDTMYIINGYGDNVYDIKAFTPSSSSWKSYYSGNGRSVIAFALKGKIYYGLDIQSWVAIGFFESDPSNNYISVRKGDFPYMWLPGDISGYFSLNDKGYVVFDNNQVWEFDPDLLQWSRKSDFPGPARIFSISFVIGDYAYFGTGQSSSNVEYNDIWKYDQLSDTWTLATRMPNVRFSATAFTLNGKAYVGFGMNRNGPSPGDYFDFYEFDPNYPVK